jgi:hypothetical protein
MDKNKFERAQLIIAKLNINERKLEQLKKVKVGADSSISVNLSGNKVIGLVMNEDEIKAILTKYEQDINNETVTLQTEFDAL